MSFILIFDIPRKNGTLHRRINRALHNIEAERLQHSVWKLKDIDKLTELASMIKQHGGKATILKEDMVVPYF